MKTLVIKVGGAFMQADDLALALLDTIKKLQEEVCVVLVHGGGPMVEELLASLNLTSVKVKGLRVTPEEQMPYIAGALAGTANKQLCGLALKAGLNPVGLSLADGKMCIGNVLNPELGRVGSVVAGDPMLLQLLVSNDMLPIISSIGADQNGQLLNINADQAATVIAQLLKAELILLSDVPGVLDADRSLIEKLDHDQINELIENGVIRDGMIVKVQAALIAAQSLGRSVTIASWKSTNELLGFLHNEPVGTKISPALSASQHLK